MKKKLVILGVSVVVALSGGLTYALTQKKPQNTYQAEPLTLLDETEPVQPIPQVPEPTVTEETQTTQEVTTEPVPVPVEPVVVRSFEQIIYDYPNMSTGAPGFPECAGYMKNAFPEYFLDHNREQNIKAISQKFINVCGAIEMKMNRSQMVSLNYFLSQNGIR